MSFTTDFLNEASEIIKKIDPRNIEDMAATLAALRERGGRLPGTNTQGQHS